MPNSGSSPHSARLQVERDIQHIKNFFLMSLF
jgi:hypothetical protein